MASTDPGAGLPAGLAELAEDFHAVGERERLQLLLELSHDLPSLPERYDGHLEKMERVDECQSPLFLAVEVGEDAGHTVNLFFDAPPEAPTTRGFAGILHEGLDGLPAEEVLAVPDDAPYRFALAEAVHTERQQQIVVEPARTIVRPRAVDDNEFHVRRENTAEGPAFRVIGERPARWVRQTDFSNDEAVGYLAERLNRLGVEDELLKAGAVAGSTVLIGPEDDAVVFDWQPTISAGAELLGQRGTDIRLEDRTRPTRGEKRETFHGKMDAAAAARKELDEDRRAGVWTDPDDD